MKTEHVNPSGPSDVQLIIGLYLHFTFLCYTALSVREIETFISLISTGGPDLLDLRFLNAGTRGRMCSHYLPR